MTTEIVVALIGVVSSLIVAIYSSIRTIRNERRVELLKSELEERKEDRNARRDYEYEAKKRLYQEYEPLLFQLSELSDIALSRIEGIAKNFKEGLLDKEWTTLDNPYFKETVYKLFSPLAVIKLIQRNLTIVDFTIENNVFLQHRLMKILYASLQEDGKIARYIQDTDYYDEWKVKHTKSAAGTTGRQGISQGEVEKIARLFIASENGEKRIIDYGEYEDLLDNPTEKTQAVMGVAEKLFLHFHPHKKPVLWTLLLSQAVIFYFLAHSTHKNWIFKETLDATIEDFFVSRKTDFSYSSVEEENEPYFEGARTYLRKTLEKKIKL